MKKCIIICWFGKLPNYYYFWEKSAAYNNDYDFLIFCDQKYVSKYNNIKFIYKSLKEMNEMFSNKLNMKINILKPYKFCDFRPAYGIIFENYLKKYDFWGHCDIDQIFGKISDFIIDDILKKYEKINFNGHFTLYKNINKINNLYKKDGSIFNYEEVFLSNENYAFDEYTGIKMISKKENIKTYYLNDFADIDKRYLRYKCINHNNYNEQFFTWEEGKIYRYYKEKGKILKQEFMYLHFQKKNPNFQTFVMKNEDKIIIGRDKVYISNIVEYKKAFNINKNKGKIYESLELIKYLLKKYLSFLRCSKKEKIIWIKQKMVKE